MRQRSQTIGTLGRSPARQSRAPSVQPPPRSPEPPPPERGTIRRWLHGAFAENLGLKFLSIVLAITVFLLVNDDKAREITVRVPVAYSLPDDRVLVSERVEEVKVTITGPWRRLRKFDERELGRISIDLRNAPSGEIAITPDMLTAPSGVTISAVSPRSMRVAFDKRTEKLVEVQPAVAGRPQHGYLVHEIKPTPATVKVRGGERLINALTSVRSREISVEGRTESFATGAQLVPPDGIEVVGADSIAVRVDIDEELVTRKLPGVTVAVKGDGVDPAKWTITPSQVDVTLTGALLAVEKTRGAMMPVVKVTTGDKGAREGEVTIEGLPPGIGVRISPERVKITPLK
jgi:YbbR domain-containing protein